VLEADSETNLSVARDLPSSKNSRSKASKAKVKPKMKPEDFPGLVTILEKWNPSDPKFTRSILADEIRATLEAESYAIINSCVPALIVDGKYPVEVMHFRLKDDIDEFVTRMVWMHEVFKSAIGIMIGVPDEKTSSLIEDVCSSLLKMNEDCVIILI
jgi:hypothetical protein